MGAPSRSYVLLIGSQQEFDALRLIITSGPDEFEAILHGSEGAHASLAEQIGLLSPEVVVIGASVASPLPLAREVRAAGPRTQIVFVLPPERLDRFRASLPFIPQLASSWTADGTAPPASLRDLVSDAARVARERASTALVLTRINQQLAFGKTAAAVVRRSQMALSERYLATVLTQSPDGFIAVGPSGGIIAMNEAAARMFGATYISANDVSVLELFPLTERSKLQDALARAMRGEVRAGLELAFQISNGESLFFELSLAPVLDESGTIASISMTARDVTDRKRAVKHQQLLINELNHRVKNTLAIVQGLAQQSFRGEVQLAEGRAAFEARLGALAAAHDLLTSHNWEAAALLEIVKTSISATIGADASRVSVRGPDILFDPQTAVAVAMALHELCTNAIKYGALSTATGTVDVRWSVNSDGSDAQLRLCWAESGGPTVKAPVRRGFGTRLLEQGLAADLRGSAHLDFRPSGLICTIHALLPSAKQAVGSS